MKTQIEEIKEDIQDVQFKQESAYELAIRTMEQNYKREKLMVRILFIIIIILLAINAYFAYQFTTTTVVETTEEWSQDGTYNVYNKDGSMVNGDVPNGETELQENE